MTDPYPFLNEAPEGFDRTNELKWFKDDGLSATVLSVYVLCQKWAIIHVEPTESGEVLSFRECWVRVPVQMP